MSTTILDSASVLHTNTHNTYAQQNGHCYGHTNCSAQYWKAIAADHHQDSAGPGPGHRRRKSGESVFSRVAPLVRLIRDPAAAVAGVVEGLRDPPEVAEERKEREREEQRRMVLYARLKNATTHKDWRAAAEELDFLEGNALWKADPNSPDYDADLIEARLKQLDDARISCDVERMLFLVRTSLARGLGDMGNVRLYRHSHIGTKDLIERYINSALDTLKALLEYSSRKMPPHLDSKHILDQVLQARQAFGRSALLLSGGATFGMYHVGVLKALWENKLLPRIISGASAGSIVSAVLCTSVDEEIPKILEELPHGDLAVFEKNGDEETVLQRVARFLKIGAWIDISHLTRVMKNLLGDMTFQEAYNRTRRILNICVSSAGLYELPRLLNYITAPNVLIWSAVAASCSVPLVFSTASILAKHPKTGKPVPWNPSPQRWIDGSVDNDLPMTRLAEMFNVNHFIVSQVNPHVVPFVARGESEEAIPPPSEPGCASPASGGTGAGWVETLTNLAKGEALHRMHVLSELGIFPTTLTKARSVLSQKYLGDITIFPEISYADFPRMLKNPTAEFMLQAVLRGERATWPKLGRIRNHCAVELGLDDLVQRLRARVVFSPSQVDLRLNTFYGVKKTTSGTRIAGTKVGGGHPRRKGSRASLPGEKVTFPKHAQSSRSTTAAIPPKPLKKVRDTLPPSSSTSTSTSSQDFQTATSSSGSSEEQECVDYSSELRSPYSDPDSASDSDTPTTIRIRRPQSSPSTPSTLYRPNFFSSTTVPPLLSTPPATIMLGQMALSMTPATATGSGMPSPEIATTRAFVSGSGSEGVGLSVDTGGVREVVVDISGTRGIVLRKKEVLRRGKSTVGLDTLR